MMGFDDFGLGVLASMLANKLDRLFKPADHEQPTSQTPELPSPAPTSIPRKPKFRTFDAWNDLSPLLATVKDPLLSVLIEDAPSTHYRLASLVLESRTTGEWFVFSRGRMSFEGTGGGLRNSRDILANVRLAGVAVGVWVLPQSTLNDLDNGYELWPAVRTHAVPLLAVIRSDYSWSEIEENVKSFV
jgi:hypothetical protein